MKSKESTGCSRSRLLCVASGLMLIALCFVGAGCHDDSRFDHDAPDGQGTLAIDNFTGDRIQVYIGGTRVDDTGAGKLHFYDVKPATYRVVLNSASSDRFWAADVDILVGRISVVELHNHPTDYRAFETAQFLE
ncbi:MAG: hypothetical protein M5U15_06565 [Kiritimatiellae bacterium]|nr:hypothetical protein [Kiritimatiellia bacterium]